MIINILIHNDFLEEETIRSGFGTMLKTNNKTLKWFRNIDKSIPITNMEHILLYLSTNFIIFDIPQIYLETIETKNNISTLQELLTEMCI